MARSLASPRAQRGVALLALLAVAVMVFGYVLASRLNAASQFVAVNREANARALAQAKKALIGWMAINAAGNDANPGRLPCPEALNAIGTDSEGIAAPLVTPSTPNCTTVGRLPWRTLGLGKLVDTNAEPLWYAVSPGWALQISSTLLTINSESLGNMVIDGLAAPNDVVALIIAPGPAMNVQAAAGCTARAQARATPAPAMNPLDYIECFNAATPAFSTTGPATSFNDQVLRVTVGDLMPALEAAIADRMQRQIAPAIRNAAYTSAVYFGLPTTSPVPPLYPYPAPFANPTASVYQITGMPDLNSVPPYPGPPYSNGPPWAHPPVGDPAYSSTDNPQGLLPFNRIASGCTPPPPCSTLPIHNITALRSTLSGYIEWYSCSTSATEVLCEGRYHEDDTTPTNNVRIEMAVTFDNFVTGFRSLVADPVSQMLVEARDNGSTGAWTTVAATPVQVRINDGYTALPDGNTPPPGSVTFRFRALMPNIDTMGWGQVADFRMRLNRGVFTDHALLDRNNATTGWFVRNEWYRNTYFAVAPLNTADSLPSIGCSAASGNCLYFNDSGTSNIRALLVLAGRRLPTQGARPSGNELDYVEGSNGDNGTRYEQRIARTSNTPLTSPFYAPWNDRVILVDWDPASPPNASQAVVSTLPPAVRVVSLP